jgi:porphobilinogen synthase
MPGQFQLAPAALKKQVAEAVDAGLHSILLFGIPKNKDPEGSNAWNADGVVQKTVRMLKAEWPELIVITDVCLCEYTSHGHCGLLSVEGAVLNDPTLELLARTAVSHARAGADMVAPSDMMDGRVAAVRTALDREAFCQLPIMSYSVKYASAYYGPFREAAQSAPKSGDRKSYQMDPGNAREGLREAAADLAEGADILMVKPAGSYGDMIRLLADNFDAPIAAYQVSGEYSMIKAAGQRGWIDEEAVVVESLIGIKRAGADLILSYFTEDLLTKGLVR